MRVHVRVHVRVRVYVQVRVYVRVYVHQHQHQHQQLRSHTGLTGGDSIRRSQGHVSEGQRLSEQGGGCGRLFPSDNARDDGEGQIRANPTLPHLR